MASGQPVWHASIAYWPGNAIVPIERWGDGVRREARRQLIMVLDGVGAGEAIENIFGRNPKAVHHRKSLSNMEIAMLSSDWLAIPARDEFGPDGLIETRL